MATISEFSIERTAAERRAAVIRFHLRVFGKWLAIGIPVMLILGALLTASAGMRSTGLAPIVSPIIYPVLVAGWLVLRGARPTPFNSGRFRFVADDAAGLHVRNDVIDQTIAWPAYRSFATDSRYLYLQTSWSRAQVLPLAEPGVQALADWLRSTGRLRR